MEDTNQSVVLMLDLPAKSLCGINLLSFTTNPKFQGIKGLPPGIHFIFTGATNSFSVRHGVWFRIERPNSTDPIDVVIKKWDAEREELVDETDKAEQLRWRANLGTIWNDRLTPYRQSAATKESQEDGALVEQKGDWGRLSDFVTSTLLSRILGGEWNDWKITSASSAKEDMEDIAGLSQRSPPSSIQPEKVLKFLPINLKETWRAGATGRERTEGAQDRSWALGNVISNYCSYGIAEEVIGEMQFSFLMVLTLNNFSCLEQWKRILSLMFTCSSAIAERPELYIRLLECLNLQLHHHDDIEGGLLGLEDETGVMIRRLLKIFRRNLDDVFSPPLLSVRNSLDELEAFLKSEFDWYLSDSWVRSGMLELEDGEQVEMDTIDMEDEDETGEYAPVVLDLEALPKSIHDSDSDGY
ncbi:MAG: hypothetical protein M1819_006461 [Sarea resinae]|nr:MAG: hypothetical protein M1819_006461 [Sarea resinae]